MAADRDDDTRAAAPGGHGTGSRDAVWRQELDRLDRLHVVAQAQDIVAAAEHTDLTHALAAAGQQLADARGGWPRNTPTEIWRPSPRRQAPSSTPGGRRRI